MANLVGLLVFPFAVMLNGWVVSVLWDWYIVPLLGANSIGMAGGIGIALIVTAMTYQRNAESGEVKNLFESILESLLRSVIILGLGFLYISIWPV